MTIIALNRYWVIRWPWVLVSLMTVFVLMILSFWQLSRATEKTQTLARIANWKQQGAVNIEKISLMDGNNIDGLQMDFSARWLSPMVWLLDNQVVDGRIGYDVIVAVEDSVAVKNAAAVKNIAAAEKTSAILVNLGWVVAPAQRDLLPQVVIPRELHVQGIFRTRTTGLLLGTNLEDAGVWPMRIQQLDVKSLAPYVHEPLHAGVIYQQQNSPFVLHYTPVILPAERHRAYALQWALLAVAVIVIAIAASARKELVHD